MKRASPEQILFAEALQRANPEARAAYLDASCAADRVLRRRVDALLRAAEDAGDFLERPPTALRRDTVPSTLTSELCDAPGEQIGRYKLLEKIGEGGCGVVYMADQEEPVRRRVALKIIKLGMDTRSVIARFEAERQALALMDHPNIAKVLDGGATPNGRPYFVMELVRGVRITEFCEEARLPTAARLQLFIQVCQAIQHAHQKGIIHRDLKPSNILVTVNDGAPVPKVIDFGIAKATGQRLTEKTVFTQFHSFIGTPAYTSPEQAEMSSVDIDTRSDIYSLGVLLYELLTGKTPFDGEELIRSGLDEMRRVIRETVPPRPSTRLMSLLAAGERTGTPTAKPRQSGRASDPSRRPLPTKDLVSLVRGDLDWIVMKCLEKDRARRYATANGLAADIQRHLDYQPVTARSPSRMYLLQKLAQRNRATLMAGTAVLVALLVAVLTLATSNARIRGERNLKDQALQERGKALEAARSSEQRARDQLLVSLQNQAQARRNSRQIGQRIESLAALSEAAKLRPTPELRDNAIAAMALPDIELGPVLNDWNLDANGFAFDSHNQRYASIGPGGVSVKSIPDGSELGRFAVDQGAPITLFTFSPDGRFLAAVDNRGTLSLWRWANSVVVLKDSSGHCSACTFSPDTRRFAVGRDGWVICFDLSSGKELRRWQSRDEISTMEFSPDGQRIAIGYQQSNVVSVYDSDDGRLETDLPLGDSSNTAVAWHPAGELIAIGGSDPRIQIWEVKSRRKIAVLEGHAQQIYFLAFHNGGNLLLSSSWDGSLRLWQTSPGRLLMRLPLPGSMGFGGDDHWAGVVAIPNHQAQLWGIISSDEYHTFLNSFGNGEVDFYEGDISPDGRLLALAGSDGVRIWDVASERAVAWLPLEATMAVMFRGSGSELLTCGPSNGLLRWPIRTTTLAQGDLQLGPPHRIALPFPPMRMCKAKDDSIIAVVGQTPGGSVLLDLAEETLKGRQMGHPDACFIAVSSDADRLASSGWHSDLVRLWDGPTGNLIKEFEAGLTARVYFTPDDREMIISRSKEFTFRDLKTLEVSRRLPRQIGLHPGHVAFTSDAKVMALEMAPGLIHLKEISSGRTLAKLEDPDGDLCTWMGFTPDGTQLVVAARYAGAIHRWDLRAIRARLKTMKLDWDWPEFPPAAPVDSMLSQYHRPMRVEVVGATLAVAAVSPSTNVPPARP